jgi:hypothetical protein
LCARLLLAALLLLAQHSAWAHELGHLAAAHAATHEPQGGDVPHAPVELCRLCLSFAQIDTAAAPAAGVMPLVAQVAQAQAMRVPRGTLRIAPPARRSRSPPMTG